MELERALELAAREAAIQDGISLDNFSSATNSAVQPPKQEYRRGKWTEEEEMYALRLIAEFKEGTLPLAEGTTLRTFLSKLLRCDPMRISKKFVGNNSIGKQVFRRKVAVNPNVDPMIARRELQELERRFHQKLQSMRNTEDMISDGKQNESDKINVKSLSDFAVDEGLGIGDSRGEAFSGEKLVPKWFPSYPSHPYPSLAQRGNALINYGQGLPPGALGNSSFQGSPASSAGQSANAEFGNVPSPYQNYSGLGSHGQQGSGGNTSQYQQSQHESAQAFGQSVNSISTIFNFDAPAGSRTSQDLHPYASGTIFDRVLSTTEFLDPTSMLTNAGASQAANLVTGATNANLDGFLFPWGSPSGNALDMTANPEISGFDPNFSFGNMSALDLPNAALKASGSLMFPSMGSFQVLHDDGRFESDPNDPFRGLTMLQSASNMALDAMAQQSPSSASTPTANDNSVTISTENLSNGKAAKPRNRSTKNVTTSSSKSKPAPSEIPVSSAADRVESQAQSPKSKTSSASRLYGLIVCEEVNTPNIVDRNSDDSLHVSDTSKQDAGEQGVLANEQPVEVAVNDDGNHQVFQISAVDESMNGDAAFEGGLSIDDDHISSTANVPIVSLLSAETISNPNPTAASECIAVQPSPALEPVVNFSSLVEGGIVPAAPNGSAVWRVDSMTSTELTSTTTKRKHNDIADGVGVDAETKALDEIKHPKY